MFYDVCGCQVAWWYGNNMYFGLFKLISHHGIYLTQINTKWTM